MTQQFHAGQEVEVYWSYYRVDSSWRVAEPQLQWRKAKYLGIIDQGHHVAFLDGTRGVYSAEHIRDPKIGRKMYEHAGMP